ncbi:MAG: tetratricopeptide repeat protein [Leptolyngbyaceae cyanobacterium]
MLDTSQILLSGETLLWFRQGLAAAAIDDHEGAVSRFNRVLEVYPDFYEAWYERGLALECQGCYLDAIASFDRALSLRPPSSAACEIWHDQGNAFQYGLGNYAEAMRCYSQALQIQPNHELAWQNRGNALLYGLKYAEQALDCYRRVLAINGNNAVAWRNRGNALIDLNRKEEAIACFDQALALQPDDQVAWHTRNQTLEQSSIGYNTQATDPNCYRAGYGGLDAVGVNELFPIEGSFDSNQGVHPFTSQPFLVVEDDWGEREILLDRQQYSIGRDTSNDICLHSRFASRHHAILTCIVESNGRMTYQITDGSPSGKLSTNGILVNGQKVQTLVLQPADVIVFGPKVKATYRLSSTH